MDVESTVRRSTWRLKPFGRRALSHKPPYFSISDPADENRDTLRRQQLARMAGSGS
jgi:rRNA maturation protein Nop10